jgi:uncharacterized protein
LSDPGKFYGAGAREIQDTLHTRRLAEHIANKYVLSGLGPDEARIVKEADCFYLATADSTGAPDCSYKGGLPGFVKVVDESQLLFPSYDGNGMFRSLGNIRENPRVGMLFVDYGKPIKLRINGDAEVSTDADLMSMFHEADAVVRVTVRDVFENCPRYLHDVQRGEPSTYIPHPGHVPPDPDWKKKDEYQGLVRRTGR